MAVPWGLLLFVVGVVYGLVMPGRENKMGLFVKGLLIGLVLALVLALLGFFYGANPLGLGNNFVSFMIAVVVLSLLFVLGAWIGDLIERATHRRRVA